MGYENKSVLITGAGSGFGQRLAERLSGMGARLVLGDINEAGLEATKALCTGPVTLLRCDVSKEADCQALVAAGVEAYGGLDVLKGIDMTAHKGQVVSLIGSSGS
ncbi:MAG: SDR family NAD(P)-dependent oxidoreductase, partial [Alphaproteobacteria bacterium]